MADYEQEVTITLSQADATSISVALQEYVRYITRDLKSSPTYSEGEEMNPNSCVGRARALSDDLRQIALGHKKPANGLAVYRMVAKRVAA